MAVELPDNRPNRAFLHLVASRAMSAVAFQGSGVAIGWFVYDQTRNPLDLGLIGLFQFLPMLLLTLVAGQVADVLDRRRIALVCQLIEAAVVAILAIGVWQGWLTTAGIFVGVAIIGAAQAFERPTLTALLPGLVTPSKLPSAVAASTSAVQTAMIIGPAMGGLLYGAHALVPFVVAAVLFLCAALNAALLPRPAQLPARAPVTLASVLAGVRFVRSKPIILGAIALDMFAVLLGGATAMLPVYARDILHAGPWALGVLRMAPAVGAVGMSLYLARFPLQRRIGRTLFFAVAAFGCATIAFAFSTNIALSVAMLIVLGASDTISVVIRHSLVQLLTPDEMRGRVSAVNSLFIGTSNQLGEFRAGLFASVMGVVASVAIGGVATVAIVLIWTRAFRDLRYIDRMPGAK